MAGHFAISDGSGVSMGGPAFRRFARLIRERWSPQCSDLRNEIDEDTELFGQIYAAKLPPQEFKLFAQAVIEAAQADSDPVYRELWDELVTKVKADPRFIATRDQPL